MRKFCVILGIFLVWFAVHIPTSAYAQQGIPTHAQWGKVAIKETQAKYPQAKILDYLHEGSEVIEDSTIEKFKLWLKQNDKEFGVKVQIKYVTNTNKMVKIEFQESTS
ncbi:hypothetical protein AMS59_03615 [Lysinibacillus sp. FJAT-14745]|uniref:DUF3889 domain-containing protein n=1 Tax=Lysinibacillus sp. FJAT-14745 TaxID=1704289 RepID=UPI0006AB9167|nr:DUF3889 domain-containing protein [Lysinibacillus sp. FJAT-14745]KOP80482.1 hypothetical protein AMS59_03615 [Lysinibacillus sp. FJAT-14745]